MAEAVTQDLIIELLRCVHVRFDKVDNALTDIRAEMATMRGSIVTIQQDIHHIYLRLDRHDERLERIERRLELRELAEAGQSPYEPQP